MLNKEITTNRILKITRKKKFTGSLTKFKVYIEDHDSPELDITGVPCRMLGTLKNGEEASFKIGSGAVKVFVIADKMSRNYCNDFYAVPEGEDDVILAGECMLNPATGNAFRFYNNDSPEAEANRKKGSGKGKIILIIACIVGFALGFISAFL